MHPGFNNCTAAAGLYAGAERRANNLSPSGARPRGTSTPGARAAAGTSAVEVSCDFPGHVNPHDALCLLHLNDAPLRVSYLVVSDLRTSQEKVTDHPIAGTLILLCKRVPGG